MRGFAAPSAGRRGGAALSSRSCSSPPSSGSATKSSRTRAPTSQAQRIASGFGFLSNTAGFAVSQALIPFTESDTYARVFVVGLLNTLLVSIVGIVFATIIGVAVALGRLSPNWLLARISGGYVELIRNLPLLFQILFWYLAVLGDTAEPRQSISLLRQSVFLQQSRAGRAQSPSPQPCVRRFRRGDCNRHRRLAA